MGEEREARRVYSPGDVAERLGVSDQRLRQLAVAFERVHGDLPRRQKARVWTEESVEELERARAAVREGRATGVEAALRGDIAPEGMEAPTTPARTAGGDIAGVAGLVGELRAMREAIEEQNRIMETMAMRLEDLERQNRELREAVNPDRELEAAVVDPIQEDDHAGVTPDVAVPPSEPRRERSWWRRVFGGGA